MRTVRDKHVDQLTGLANRNGLLAHLERLARRSRPHLLIAIDLDQFKRFNLHNYHSQGDRVLCEVGSSLDNSLRSGGRAFRLGGDEFAVVLPSDDLKLGLGVAETIRGFVADEVALDQPESCGDAFCIGPTPVTCSVAVLVWRPQVSAEDLLREANELIVEAKLAGGNTTRHRQLAS